MFRVHYNPHCGQIIRDHKRLRNREGTDTLAHLVWEHRQYYENGTAMAAVLSREEMKNARMDKSRELGFGNIALLFQLNCEMSHFYRAAHRHNTSVAYDSAKQVRAGVSTWRASQILLADIQAAADRCEGLDIDEEGRTHLAVERGLVAHAGDYLSSLLSELADITPADNNGSFVDRHGQPIPDTSLLESITTPLEWVPRGENAILVDEGIHDLDFMNCLDAGEYIELADGSIAGAGEGGPALCYDAFLEWRTDMEASPALLKLMSVNPYASENTADYNMFLWWLTETSQNLGLSPLADSSAPIA